ncbi:eukaryotic translation initiation factor 4B3-like [Tasmannia lanceolata]|uniref:eukaryotic translation initiation factor 4B3-like n=1 Tax=Tasmannia lanceolata TaxID=3420 RepID=UPI0040649AD1
MATTVSAWAKPGAWALDSEQQDDLEILEQENGRVNSDSTQNNLQNPQQQQQPLSDFPSLATAAVKPKKKKSQPISLAEFTTGKNVSHGAAKAQAQARPVGLTAGELIILPTGPRERSAEELDRSRLGGGFRNYGGGGGRDYDRRSPVVGGDEANSTRWGSSRVSDEPRRNGGLGFNRESGPSRADEIDDWGAGKKSAPPPERRDRGSGSFFDSQSRADDSDNWLSNKSFVPSESKRIGGGLGFDGYKEKRDGFEMFHKEGSNADSDSDSWGRKNEERPRSGDSDSWGKKKEEGSGRPRIVLQPRTLPVSDGEQVGPVRGGKGSNPFGEARPREEVLAEKGQDWKKIDEQLESMKIKELGSSDGPSFGKKSFGSGNGRAEDLTETNWRKTDLADVTPPRAEKVDGEVADN